MKQKSSKKLKQAEELPTSPAIPIYSQTVSSDAFYSVFLSISVLVTVLLYGAGSNIISVETPVPQGNMRQMVLENKVRTLVTGFPIEAMSTIISKQNKTTAAFLVGIAKKESNWGNASLGPMMDQTVSIIGAIEELVLGALLWGMAVSGVPRKPWGSSEDGWTPLFRNITLKQRRTSSCGNVAGAVMVTAIPV
jgi:hypothetical protein